MLMRKWLDKFNRLFGFTKTERRVVVFLIASFLAGSVVKLYKNSLLPYREFDYSASDLEFAARSRNVKENDSSDTGENEQGVDSAQVSGERTGERTININNANSKELVNLPGVGEAIAERIVEYRKTHGPFISVNQLINVKGIGKKKLDKMLPYCTLGK